MRILMLAQNYAPIVGGEERMVEDLSVELGHRGHRVAVATIRPPDRDQYETREGIAIYGLRSLLDRSVRQDGEARRPQAPPAPDPRTVLDLRRVLRRECPDVVHAHNWLVHSYLPLHRSSGAALVVSLHDYGLLCATKRMLRRGVQCSGPGPAKCVQCAGRHYRGPKGAAIALGVKVRGPALRRGADLLLPVSEAVRDRCELGPADRYRVIPNFVREHPRRSIADARLARLPEQPFLLFLGDATFDKGAQHLAEAFRLLNRPPPLVFIGRCFVDGLAEHPNIRVLGPWPHELVQEALRRAMFGVVPTIMPEAFGLAALESAAAGKPVVASDIGGLREIVVPGETGCLVAPGDRYALAAALERLIADPHLRAQMGQAASRHARCFAAHAVVPAFEDAYQEAIDLLAQRNDTGDTH